MILSPTVTACRSAGQKSSQLTSDSVDSGFTSTTLGALARLAAYEP